MQMKIAALPRSFAEWIAGKLGYALIARWRLPQRELAMHPLKVLDMYHVRVVIDLCANGGEFHDFLRR